MKIGIIGAGLAGLVAAKDFMMAGHEVLLIEKDRKLGGRLASRSYENGDTKISLDYGLPYFSVESEEFGGFIKELEQKKLVRHWADSFSLYDGEQVHSVNPNHEGGKYYAAPAGMSSIANYLARWVDVKENAQAGGLTFIGRDRHKKKPWMVNLTDFSLYEADAVVLAVPAVQAYGILNTVQDEMPTRKVIRHIDEVRYDATFTLMLAVETENVPQWKAMDCNDEHIKLVVNESSKRQAGDSPGVTLLTAQSTHKFAQRFREEDSEQVKKTMINALSSIVGNWVADTRWSDIHYWNYLTAQNPMENSFIDVEMDEGPFALIGDYLGGNSMDAAYRSAKALVASWTEKY